jgi:hypothetical protein
MFSTRFTSDRRNVAALRKIDVLDALQKAGQKAGVTVADVPAPDTIGKPKDHLLPNPIP